MNRFLARRMRLQSIGWAAVSWLALCCASRDAGRLFAADIPSLYQPSYDLGYDSTYGAAFETGLAEGWTRGQKEGTTQGTDEGFDVGWQQSYTPAYELAYNVNYDAGFDWGLFTGFEAGFLEGYDSIQRELQAAIETNFGQGWNDGGSLGVTMHWGVSYDGNFGDPGSEDNLAGGVTSNLERNQGEWEAYYFDLGSVDGTAAGLAAGDAQAFGEAFPLAYAAAYQAAYPEGLAQGSASGDFDGANNGFATGRDVGANLGEELGFDAGVDFFLHGKFTVAPLPPSGPTEPTYFVSSALRHAVPEPSSACVLGCIAILASSFGWRTPRS